MGVRKEYNIVAEGFKGYLLGQWTDCPRRAELWAKHYRDKYQGKPYPNGEGFYNCRNVRIVSRERSV